MPFEVISWNAFWRKEHNRVDTNIGALIHVPLTAAFPSSGYKNTMCEFSNPHFPHCSAQSGRADGGSRVARNACSRKSLRHFFSPRSKPASVDRPFSSPTCISASSPCQPTHQLIGILMNNTSAGSNLQVVQFSLCKMGQDILTSPQKKGGTGSQSWYHYGILQNLANIPSHSNIFFETAPISSEFQKMPSNPC